MRQNVLQKGRKRCGKRRNCSLRAISPFPTVFSNDLYCRHVKIMVCFRNNFVFQRPWIDNIVFNVVFQHYFSNIAATGAAVHVFSLYQYSAIILFQSHLLLYGIPVFEATAIGERGMNPVPMTIFSPRKE